MSAFTLKDFVQIKPDPSYADLSSGQKVSILDSLIGGSTPRGLTVNYDLSHSGRRINNRIYTVAGQKWGIDSLTNPYPKPIIRNHDQSSEPIGRFVGGTYVDGSENALRYFDNVQEYMEVSAAFDEDSPERIYKTLKKYGLLTRKSWPGIGSMRVTAKISDKDAIEKFLDGRYITFSAGSTTDRHVCSVCASDWAAGDVCEHRHGRIYDDELCVFVTGRFEVLEGSVVNTPADDLSQILSMEMSDNTQIEDIKSLAVDKTTVFFSDSKFKFGEDDGVQEETNEKSNCFDRQEKEDKKIKDKKQKVSNRTKEIGLRKEVLADKEYDHMLRIPETAMELLHSSGQADIVTSSDDQEMTIRLTYDNPTRDSVDSGAATSSALTVEASLKEKAKAHNTKCGSDIDKRVTLSMLKAVWRRGADASSAGSPNMLRVGWAMARVNTFLRLVRSGSPSNPKYTTDNDLLPAGHPKKGKGKKND